MSCFCAINASQFSVTFTRAVDKVSAETLSNYLINSSALASGTDYALLQVDGKTVVITMHTATTNDNAYSIKVKNVASSTSASDIAPDYLTSFVASDKVVPSITKATAQSNTTTKTVSLEFSEPIGVVGAIQIDGISATSAAIPAVSSGNSYKLTVTAAQNLEAGKTYTIKFLGVADRAFPTANASTAFVPVTATFTVATDAAAPKFVSATAYSENEIKVTFDKAVDPASGIFTFDAVGITSGTFTKGAAYQETTDLNSIIIPVTGLTFGANNSRTIILGAKDVKDTYGNKMVTEVTNQMVTLTKDTTKPAYDSYTLSADNTKIYVKFNENLASNAAVGTTYTLVDSNGVSVGSAVASSKTLKVDKATQGKGPYLEITLTNAMTQGNYTLTIPAGTVTDASIALNANAATIVQIAAPAISDTATFTGSVTLAGGAGDNVFAVTYTKEVKGGEVAGSATLLSNYLIDGASLPAGTTVTLNAAKKIATISIPADKAPTSKNATLSWSGVQSLGGGTVTAATGAVILTDKVAPTVVSAKLSGPTTLELVMSEPVKIAGDNTKKIGIYNVTSGGTITPLLAVAAVTDANKAIAGSNVTVTVGTTAAANLADAKLAINLGFVKDIAGNDIAAIDETSASALYNAPAVADKYAQAPTVALTANVGGTAGTFNMFNIAVTKNANAAKDVEYQYDVYMVDLAAPAITLATISQYTSMNSYTSAAVPTVATALPNTILKDSNGVNYNAGTTYEVYILITDTYGNKELSVAGVI